MSRSDRRWGLNGLAGEFRDEVATAGLFRTLLSPVQIVAAYARW